MPFRILVYIVAIWLDYFKNTNEKERKRKEYRLPPIIPMVLHNGVDSWTAESEFKKYVAQADMFGKYIVNFEYILVSVKELERDFITNSNTLIDNILWSDKLHRKEDWIENLMVLSSRVSQMNIEDQNEWFTWYSNAIRFVNETERNKFFDLVKRGEGDMCSSLEQLFIDERKAGWDEAIKYDTSKQLVSHVNRAIRKQNMTLEEACDYEDTTVEAYEEAKETVRMIEAERKIEY